MIISKPVLGTTLVVVSAIVWSTVGLFAKGIDADVWTILFWRGVFSIVALTIYIAIKSETGIVREFQDLGLPGWLATIIGGAATICFISSFKYTSIANVSMIYAVVPFIAAVMAWIMIGEKATRVTLIAALIAMVGVAVMVAGSFGQSNLYGDFLAICMSLGMAALVVLFRKYPNKPMVLSVVLSAVIHVVMSWFLSSPLNVSAQDLMLLVAFGVVFAAATIFMIEGVRLIPASQSALISTLEAPLAPVWAWLVFSSIPTKFTWIGGGLILFAVAWNIIHENQNK